MGIFGKPNIEKAKRKRDVDALIKALGHKDPDVIWGAREALIEIIAESRIARDVETIIHVYREGYDDPGVCNEAIASFGKLRDKRVVELLIEILRAPPSEITLEEAVVALGKIKDERAVRPLIEALGDADDTVRRCAVETLGRIKDERATEALARTLKDKKTEVRAAATEALQALGKTKDEGVVELLVEARRKDIRQGTIYGGTRLSEIVGRRKAFELLTDDLLQAKRDTMLDPLVLALGEIVGASIMDEGVLVAVSGEFKGEKGRLNH